MQRCSGKIAFQACLCIDLQRSCRNVACNGCDTGQSNSWVLQQAKEGAGHECKGAARQQRSASWLCLRLILQQTINTYQNACSRCSQQLGLMQGRRERQASCTGARPGGICSLHCMPRSMACPSVWHTAQQQHAQASTHAQTNSAACQWSRYAPASMQGPSSVWPWPPERSAPISSDEQLQLQQLAARGRAQLGCGAPI